MIDEKATADQEAGHQIAPVVNRDLPLRCKVEDGQLVFHIGIETLAFAAEHCPNFYDYEKHGASGPPWVKVVDANELANDVCNAINDEEEDGTTPLMELLDAAIVAAFEDGSIGFAESA